MFSMRFRPRLWVSCQLILLLFTGNIDLSITMSTTSTLASFGMFKVSNFLLNPWNWIDRNCFLFCSDDTRMDIHIGQSDIRQCQFEGAVCKYRWIGVRTGGAACNRLSHSAVFPTCGTILSAHFEASLVTFDYLYCRLCHCYKFVFIQIVYMAGKCQSELERERVCIFGLWISFDGMNLHFNCRF